MCAAPAPAPTAPGPVCLGLAGGYVPAAPGSVDHFTTKVGGVACLPGPPPPGASAAEATCRVCGHQMALVLQVRST